jgi:hypothetical protein
MTDLAQDYREAKAILEGRTMMQPTVAHLKAVVNYYEDKQIVIALKVLKLHAEIRDR